MPGRRSVTLLPVTIRAEDVAAAQAIQFAAAHAPDAQVRLIAGPGSGKSLTIEERVRWLLESGVDPDDIAVVSFTNASVIDLRLRLREYCRKHHQPGIDNVSITTLHSLALRLLRQAGLLEAYPTRPLVLDDWELENIYDAEFGEAEGIDSKPRREKIRRYYEALWSTGVPNAATYVAPEPPISDEERRHFEVFHQPTARVYSAVLPGEIVRNCVQASASGLMDPAQLLGIRHLVVDEYQDLNPADLEFVDQLAAAGVTLFVAGDDDQSIYSFRHASPMGIQRFTERYPAAAPHALRHCFRCTVDVLAAATTLILNNQSPSRLPKALVSLYRTAEPQNAGVVYRWRFPTANQEAQAIGSSCAALIAAGLSPREILILLVTRDNRVALWPRIKESLEQFGVPFDPPKEEGFSDSDVGRLVLAVARVVCSRDDDGHPEDLVAHRIILGVKRGVGIGTCNRIRAFVIETPNVSFRDLFYNDLPEGLNARAVTALNQARTVCATIANWQPTDTLGQRRAQLREIVRTTIDEEAAGAWDAFAAPLIPDMTIAELRDYVWVDNAQQRAEVLEAVRRRLNIPEDPAVAAALDRVRVMTMHGAKGLAARVVFIPALEQGLIPNQYQLPYPAQILEAARLLYVSITRARAACILSFAWRRLVFGESRQQHPSMFAGQTGGAFVDGNDGLTDAQLDRIMQAIEDL